MIKKIMLIFAVAMFFAITATGISAQDVLMNSAETIKEGNLKVAVFPTILFGKDGSDSVFGVAGRVGFGITDRIDIEAKAGIFEGIKYYGVDVEYWFVHQRKLNVSAALGLHTTNVDLGWDSSGIDATILFSTAPAHRLELYGGLKFAFDKLKDSDLSQTKILLVPGFEYRMSADLDFLAEVGIALNDSSRSYASIGLALYLLR